MGINWESVQFWVVLFFILKTVIVGSDFSFYDLVKHKMTYINWYYDRQTFKQFMEKNNE